MIPVAVVAADGGVVVVAVGAGGNVVDAADSGGSGKDAAGAVVGFAVAADIAVVGRGASLLRY